ncbi:MAG: ComF family protein [Proteobacteria bacterium]|nr:ComF family protein [Pseudomonadota bacterium]
MLPLQCMLCTAATTNKALCLPCRDDLDLLKLHTPCPRCGMPQTDAAICSECTRHPPPWQRLFVRYQYQAPLTMLVLQYKFGKRWQLATTLAELMPTAPAADVVLPIPLHSARQHWRGFNQAHELARKMQLRPATGLLTRIVNTPPQTTLPDKAARRKNIRGAFVADSAVQDLSVLLVDDVMTSGATLFEAARTLKKAGCKTVNVLILARAV